jgi:WD40 repeat protein
MGVLLLVGVDANDQTYSKGAPFYNALFRTYENAMRIRATPHAAAIILIVLGVAGYKRYVQIPTNVAYVSEEDGGISTIDLRTMKVIRRVQPEEIAPRGIDITRDGKYVIVADKDTADASVFDSRGLRLIRRIHVGDNPEFVKLNPAGDGVFTSYEPGSAGGPPIAGSVDDDADKPPSHIVKYQAPEWKQELDFVAGTETEGLEFSPDEKYLLVANEAQNNIGIYDQTAGTLVRSIRSKALRPASARHKSFARRLRLRCNPGGFGNTGEAGLEF